MDQLTETWNLKPGTLKKSWYKRPAFYIWLVLVILVAWGAYRFGIVYNTISVDNGNSFWHGVAGIFNFGGSNKEEEPDYFPMPEPEADRLDVLLLGLRGDDEQAIEEEGGLLTDSIMIVSIDKVNKKSAIVSIPRDLYVDINVKTSKGENVRVKGRVNEVYERGLAKSEGIGISKQLFSKLAGVYIDYAVAVDFNAFKEVVNTLGGIDIKLTKPFEEKNQWGYEFLLPAGNNHLDGEKALYYVRSRYSTSDFDRAKRQQEVMVVIKNKALSLGFLSNPTRIASLMSDLKDNIRTDFKIWDVGDVLKLADAVGSEKAIRHVLTTENLLYETKTEKGEYVLLAKENNYGRIRDLFVNLFVQIP